MKRALPAVIISVFFSGSSLWADPIPVRSGEHSDFTRLVMPFPDGATWRLENDSRRASIILGGFDDGFDLSNAFSVIPRTRLNALVATQSRLELQLNCDCDVSGFVEYNGFLVVDISDKVARVSASRKPPDTVSALPNSRFQFGELLWSFDESQFAPPDENPYDDARELGRPGETEPSVRMQDIEVRRQDILKAFSAAASKGLVEIDDSLSELTGSEPPDSAGSIRSEPMQIDEYPVENVNGNIRVTSSRDVQDPETPDPFVSLAGATCPDPDLLQISAWATEEPVEVQIGRSNRALFDDAGRFNYAEALSRVRIYLYFGFGAEARQLLTMIPNASSDYPELHDLAQYFEYGFVRNPRILHQFPDCNSAFALWGMLAPQTLSEDSLTDTEAALRALKALPAHIRYIAAQDLSEILLQRGDLQNGTIAMRLYEQLPQHDDGEVRVANAVAESLRKNNSESRGLLSEVVAEGSNEAPIALIKMIDQLVSQGDAIPSDTLTLTEAYLFEFRGTDLAPSLLRANILAAAQSLLFDSATEVYLENSDDFDDAQKREVASQLFLMIASAASDIEFLERYYADYTKFQDWVDETSTVAVADRLFMLGFSTEALAVVERLDEENPSARAQILRAKLHLAEGEYLKTIDELERLRSLEADRIRAAALQGLGENAEARDLFFEAERPDLATYASWMSNEWKDLIDPDDPVFGPIRNLASEDLPGINRDKQIVEDTSKVLEASGLARKALEDLLDAVDVSN